MAANLNELIFIKRVKKHPHEASHGGAWKIAYADFVTAMMAFFLLLWLLSSTSQEQRTAISNYFAPQSASLSTSGSGGLLGGRVLDTEGALTASMSSPRIMLGVPQVQPGTEVEVENPNEGEEANSGPLPKNELENPTGVAMGTVPTHDLKSRNEAMLGTVADNDAKDAHDVALARSKETSGTEPLEGKGGSLGDYPRETEGLLPDGGGPGVLTKGNDEDTRLAEVERQLKERIEQDPALNKYRTNITVERTSEGVRVQIIDDEKREMFPLGSAEMLDHTSKLIKTVAEIVKNQPNRIAISGHTDSTPYRGSGGYSNWELSTDRANASRRALMAAGVAENRIARVVGKADTEPMDAVHPDAATNRRVSIVLLREGNGGGSHAPVPGTSAMVGPHGMPGPTSPAPIPHAAAMTPVPTPSEGTAAPPPFAAPVVAAPSAAVTESPAKLPEPEPEKRVVLPWPEPATPLQPARAEGVIGVGEPEAPPMAETQPEAQPEAETTIEADPLDGEPGLQDNWLRLR